MTSILNFEKKVIALSDLLLKLKTLQFKKIVFTNGCFDILHRGHVTYLAKAKELGDILIVAVNSDSSVKMLQKGVARPYNNENDRMSILAALAMTDFIVLFEEETPLNLIKQIKPHILVKGGDWAASEIVGASEVLNNNGEVFSIPFDFNRSTTALIDKILTTSEK